MVTPDRSAGHPRSVLHIAGSLVLFFGVALASAPLLWETMSESATRLDARADLLEALSEVAERHVESFQRHVDLRNGALATQLREELDAQDRDGLLDVPLAPTFTVRGSCRLDESGVRAGLGTLDTLTLDGWDELYQQDGKLMVPAVRLTAGSSVTRLVADVVDKVNKSSRIYQVERLLRVDFGLPAQAHLPAFAAVDVCAAQDCASGEDCTTSPVLRCWLSVGGDEPVPLTVPMRDAAVVQVEVNVFQWLSRRDKQLAARLSAVNSPRVLFSSDWEHLHNAKPTDLASMFRKEALEIMNQVGSPERVGQHPALPAGSLFGPLLWMGALSFLIPTLLLVLEGGLMSMHRSRLTREGVESWFSFIGFGLMPSGELTKAYRFATLMVVVLVGIVLGVLLWVGSRESGLLFSVFPGAPWIAGLACLAAAVYLWLSMRRLHQHALDLGT